MLYHVGLVGHLASRSECFFVSYLSERNSFERSERSVVAISRPKMYVRLHTCGAYGWCIQKVLPFQKAVYLFLCMPGTYAWVARERMRQVPLKKVVDLHAHWVYLQCMQKYVEPVQEPVLSTDSN